jgi:large subunit ribosomal protein L5
MSQLARQYEEKIKPALMKEFDIKNHLATPRLTKIVVNMGTGEALKDKAVAEKIKGELAVITGQQPAVRAARISVAGFGIRAGQPVGLMVTLRGKRMYDFFERLTKIVLPRLRDFRGVSMKSFDGSGNYTLGVAENTTFPEIDQGNVDKPRGLEITIVTSAEDKKQAKRLLEEMGMPFEKEEL